MASESPTIVRDLTVTIVSAVAIAGVMILLERPETRRLATMRAAHYARAFCQWQADLWQSLALSAAQAYQKARL